MTWMTIRWTTCLLLCSLLRCNPQRTGATIDTGESN